MRSDVTVMVEAVRWTGALPDFGANLPFSNDDPLGSLEDNLGHGSRDDEYAFELGDHDVAGLDPDVTNHYRDLLPDHLPTADPIAGAEVPIDDRQADIPQACYVAQVAIQDHSDASASLRRIACQLPEVADEASGSCGDEDGIRLEVFEHSEIRSHPVDALVPSNGRDDLLPDDGVRNPDEGLIREERVQAGRQELLRKVQLE